MAQFLIFTLGAKPELALLIVLTLPVKPLLDFSREKKFLISFGVVVVDFKFRPQTLTHSLFQAPDISAHRNTARICKP
ncbi:unnamed protein product [Pleuronectes platessa]|uniref:Uncharacterized protein n=1 Tax=Pleuronectes platessa TaxID=8262 RepID=A0A9N7VGZ4_PLEPL|nr:unnamed protein product [Pleuronectes platessa]